MAMDSPYGTGSSFRWVSPFRHLRVDGYLLLTAAFRSLSRLSSALSAKASTLRPYKLDLRLCGLAYPQNNGLIDSWSLKLNSYLQISFLRFNKDTHYNMSPTCSNECFAKLKIGLLLSLGLLDIDVNMQFSRYNFFD